jgi:ribosomal protein L11 methyltransferase
MYCLSVECFARDKDYLVAELWERGTLGIEERELPPDRWELLAYFEEQFTSNHSGAHWQEVADEDWVAVFKDSWRPVEVGHRFFLVPYWRADAPPPGRLRLEIYPGLATGTGEHPSTQLCLEVLEQYLRPGDVVLDLGTGSGILAQGAWLLGTRTVIACDIDLDAVAIASENLRRARVPALVFAGSARSVRSGVASLVVANINAAVIFTQASEIARLLSPGGHALLGGFPARQKEAVQQAMERHGCVFRQSFEREGWVCSVFRSEAQS